MISKIFWGLLLIVLLAGVVVAAVFVGSGRFFATEIHVSEVGRGRAVDAVPGVVAVRAKREIELRAEIGGRVLETELRTGEKVRAGEVLLRLDDGKLRRERERIRLDLEAEEEIWEIGLLLRFDLEEAEEELERLERLRLEGRVSEREFRRQERAVARLKDEIALREIRGRQSLQTLRNELERLDMELEKMVLRAPEDGVVLSVSAYPGDLVGGGGMVARLLSDERIVEASLSEEHFAGVKIGQKVTVRFLGYGSRLFEGRVGEVLPAADPRTQRYQVYLDLEMPEEMLVPGISGEVSIVLDEREEALLIPRRALVGRQVFRVGEDGVAELRRVETGFVGLNRVEILSGLQEGDRVAVERLDRLRDGDRVRF